MAAEDQYIDNALQPYGYYLEEVQASLLPFIVQTEEWQVWKKPTSLMAAEMLVGIIFPAEPCDERYLRQLTTYDSGADTTPTVQLAALVATLQLFRRLEVPTIPPVRYGFGYSYHCVYFWTYRFHFPRAFRSLAIDDHYRVIVSYRDNHHSLSAMPNGVEYRVKLLKRHDECYIKIGHSMMTVGQFVRGLYEMIRAIGGIRFWDADINAPPGSFCTNRYNELLVLGDRRNRRQDNNNYYYTLLHRDHQINSCCGLVNHKSSTLGLLTILSAALKFVVDEHPNDVSISWQQRVYISEPFNE